ncbi:MAG TPA: hypothetical protein VGO66_12940 [Solirubrobacterales bacterium]|jgi:hypothetical protein|nr:hypothetical protein [Solirubrobacterales bacterium]
MIVGSIPTSISVSLDERDALRRHLLDTEGVWSRRDWDLPTIAAKWADAYRLLADLDRDADTRGTLDLTLPPADLRRAFTDIREGLFEIDGLEPEHVLIVAGGCERVLVALDLS